MLSVNGTECLFFMTFIGLVVQMHGVSCGIQCVMIKQKYFGD